MLDFLKLIRLACFRENFQKKYKEVICINVGTVLGLSKIVPTLHSRGFRHSRQSDCKSGQINGLGKKVHRLPEGVKFGLIKNISQILSTDDGRKFSIAAIGGKLETAALEVS